MVAVLVMCWKPVIRKQQLEKEDLELQEGVIETSWASKHGDLFYNPTMTFCSIKLKEGILLNIISKKKG